MNSPGSHLLFTVSGQDGPGITSKLMQVLEGFDCSLIDMGQSVTHGLLSLSFLVNFKEANAEEAVKDLLYQAKTLGLNLDFKIVSPSAPELQKEGEKYVLSCVSVKRISPKLMAAIAGLFAQNFVNILRIDKTGKQEFFAMEIQTAVPDIVDITDFKKQLVALSNIFKVDLAFLKENVFRRSKRLIVFDMDSTLIRAEVIDEMAEIMGVGDKVKAITEQAMNGERNFDQSLTERVSLLKGLTRDQMREIAERIELNAGVETFINTAKKLGYKLGVISGGFSYFTNYFKNKLDLDYAFGNELEMVGNQATGKISGTMVNPQQKAMILDLLAQQNNISLEQVVAIGDGANDLPMLAKAGLGIAYHAKESVRQKASQQVSHGTMTSILYFLGINEEE